MAHEKIALVTGASKGIGLETVRQLAAKGVHVLLGARTLAKATEAATPLQASGLSVEPKKNQAIRLCEVAQQNIRHHALSHFLLQ